LNYQGPGTVTPQRAARRIDDEEGSMSAQFTMYTTSWCGYCLRLKKGLEEAGITFSEVNIEQDENAAVRVMEVNGGNQTVPTLEFADGSALTNPSVGEVRDKLASLA
jgi:mycoredoxin